MNLTYGSCRFFSRLVHVVWQGVWFHFYDAIFHTDSFSAGSIPTPGPQGFLFHPELGLLSKRIPVLSCVRMAIAIHGVDRFLFYYTSTPKYVKCV